MDDDVQALSQFVSQHGTHPAMRDDGNVVADFASMRAPQAPPPAPTAIAQVRTSAPRTAMQSSPAMVRARPYSQAQPSTANSVDDDTIQSVVYKKSVQAHHEPLPGSLRYRTAIVTVPGTDTLVHTVRAITDAFIANIDSHFAGRVDDDAGGAYVLHITHAPSSRVLTLALFDQAAEPEPITLPPWLTQVFAGYVVGLLNSYVLDHAAQPRDVRHDISQELRETFRTLQQWENECAGTLPAHMQGRSALKGLIQLLQHLCDRLNLMRRDGDREREYTVTHSANPNAFSIGFGTTRWDLQWVPARCWYPVVMYIAHWFCALETVSTEKQEEVSRDIKVIAGLFLMHAQLSCGSKLAPNGPAATMQLKHSAYMPGIERAVGYARQPRSNALAPLSDRQSAVGAQPQFIHASSAPLPSAFGPGNNKLWNVIGAPTRRIVQPVQQGNARKAVAKQLQEQAGKGLLGARTQARSLSRCRVRSLRSSSADDAACQYSPQYSTATPACGA